MLDTRPWFANTDDLAARSPNPLAKGLFGSDILRIAGEIRARQAAGAAVTNFSIGDFAPSIHAIPDALSSAIQSELANGQTNYPPAEGLIELREAVCDLYRRELDLNYDPSCVQVGSGARPPIYAAFGVLVAPGDKVVYPVPSWNVNYYVYLTGGVGVPLVTSPDNGFMPTADELRPHLSTARLLVINSPQNPSGTVIAPDELRAISELIVAENHRREALGERPLFLLYDAVYWQLTFAGSTFATPMGLVPEMARYTVMVDAISKCWAATGLRVGWSVSPPWIRDRMKPLIGHMGAWAARAEQRATAALLRDPELLGDYMPTLRADMQRKLARLADGLRLLKAEGLPCDALDPQGALYLTARFALHGRTLDGAVANSDEDVRKWLLAKAGVGIVPFASFGYPEGDGWVRFSVGAVDDAGVDAALARLGGALRSI